MFCVGSVALGQSSVTNSPDKFKEKAGLVELTTQIHRPISSDSLPNFIYVARQCTRAMLSPKFIEDHDSRASRLFPTIYRRIARGRSARFRQSLLRFGAFLHWRGPHKILYVLIISTPLAIDESVTI